MTHVTCRLTAKNRDQLRNPTLDSLYGLPLPFLPLLMTHRVKIDVTAGDSDLAAVSDIRVSTFGEL